MVCKENDLPPIFNPNTPKYDQIIGVQDNTRAFTKPELEKMLEDRGLNSDGDVRTLRAQTVAAKIPLKDITSHVLPGYVGKPKEALQIAAEREFVDLDGNWRILKSIL